jgi:3-keto-5-aminohexanoate cleavage enzyme
MPIDALPQIMVAPNGARRTTQDHPSLPMRLDDTIAAAIACKEAGAGGLHAHVRDADGGHVLDAGLYLELLAELNQRAPDFTVQITTEAVGRYTPKEQRTLVETVMPGFVSIALREMVTGENDKDLCRFYHWAYVSGIGVQHILYTPEEVLQLASFVKKGVIPAQDLEVLFVLGRYSTDQQSSVSDLLPFVANATQVLKDADWALCAFGQQETSCLAEAVRQGGKARIGFENNLHNRDGSIAADNAERVHELVAELKHRKLVDMPN